MTEARRSRRSSSVMRTSDVTPASRRTRRSRPTSTAAFAEDVNNEMNALSDDQNRFGQSGDERLAEDDNELFAQIEQPTEIVAEVDDGEFEAEPEAENRRKKAARSRLRNRSEAPDTKPSATVERNWCRFLYQKDDLVPIFIFVNPCSGSKSGASLLESGIDHLLITEGNIKALVTIVDISKGESGKKEGFLQLKGVSSEWESQHPIRVIAGGGDGTVTWVIEELLAHGVPTPVVALGILPFGTANDLANVLGWKTSVGNLTNRSMKSLRSLVKRWTLATVENFDIWTVTIEVSCDGKIEHMVHPEKRLLCEENGDLKLKLEKTMIDFFSLGVDARLGIGFERNRKSNASLNKLTYATEALKKLFFKTTPRVNQLLEQVTDGDKLLAHTDESHPDGDSLLKADCRTLIFSNIASYGAGCDMWAKCRKLSLAAQHTSILNARQSHSDEKLEVITYHSLTGLMVDVGINRSGSGSGHRAGQLAGPVELSFRDLPPDARVYCQIDGEFHILHCPVRAVVSFQRKIQVLRSADILIPERVE